MDNPDAQSNLAPLRKRIDQLDREIVDLLNERAKIVVEIGKVKRDGKTPVYAPERERKVLDQVRSYNKGPLPDACLIAMWRELMSGSFALERSLRVGYLGPPGSFSHVAARRKFGSAGVEYNNLEDIQAIFDEIGRGHVDLGLVPVENSEIGGIGETLDSFLDTTAQVYGEVLINVHHNVLANCSVEEIKRVYSKPEVFSQCRRWLGVQLRQAERIPVASSSKAAEMASKESGAAAIGSTLAAEIYNLKIQFANIEDNPANTTRFFIISPNSAKATGDDKTALMFTTAHKAGALAEVLEVFRDANLNLTNIANRPSKRANWEYAFFIECPGHHTEPHVARAIEAARKHCLQLTVLGSFPRADEIV